ncbi:hypothetical protein DFP72DRAFT_1108055 [Ephemerocybe angulata]|uniref:Uncharacterized protein n=1 Tax=Ephemerocybe angulata TaxID=980116 RepID=A0A8H6IJD1_9AGAR|nr:hypothetical protein DFP72DRAFT_1108055 [Tulosesus angulatus]
MHRVATRREATAGQPASSACFRLSGLDRDPKTSLPTCLRSWAEWAGRWHHPLLRPLSTLDFFFGTRGVGEIPATCNVAVRMSFNRTLNDCIAQASLCARRLQLGPSLAPLTVDEFPDWFYRPPFISIVWIRWSAWNFNCSATVAPKGSSQSSASHPSPPKNWTLLEAAKT